MRPFLRWAGGKRWLAQEGFLSLSDRKRLVEPFVGGGALFFSREWSGALLSDTNRYLINAYLQMKEDHKALFALLMRNFDLHTESHYYDVRRRLGSSTVQDAADFIYLNRACFNGLFRVNLAGRFNVPIGSKVYELRDKLEYEEWSRKLLRAEIRLSDFEETIGGCGEGDLIFADPPYTVNHNSNGFIEYNEKIFSWNDQVRLHRCLTEAAAKGAEFVLTNADHSTVRDLYQDCTLEAVVRGSEMAGSTSARGRTTEVVITSLSGQAPAPSISAAN